MERTRNAHLAAIMAEAGISNKALAREVRELGRRRGLSLPCTHIDVARWLSGMRPRDPKPELIASALSLRLGRVVTLADIGMGAQTTPPLTLGLEFSDDQRAVLRTNQQLWSEDLRRSDFLRHGTVSAAMLISPMARWLIAPPADAPIRSGRITRVTASDVEAVRATARMFEDLDHRYGGGHARAAAVQYLQSELLPLLHAEYSDRIGRELFAVAAQFTYKTGAMAYDVGMHGLARRYFVQALSLAHISGDRALGGKVLALMSHQANFLGEYREAVDLARAAKLGGAGHATPTVHAMYCTMEARALASLGDRRSCIKALREAEQVFARRDAGADPDWIAYFDEAELHDEFGHCFAVLGQSEDAVHYSSLCLRQSNDAYPRSRTFCRFTLAGAYLTPHKPRQREVEQACAVAGEALGLVDRLKSARVRAYIRSFERRLEPYAQVRAVNDFHERLRDTI